MPRSLDIIVPVYRNAELTRACVDSILRHQGEIAERRPRLLLINDSPDDDEVVLLLRALAAGRDDVSVLTNETNLGFVQTVNRGLALARQAGHDVLLVNSDTLTFPGTLTELLRATEDDEQIGFASPRSNNASLCSLPHFHGGAPATPEEAHRRWSILSATMPPWHFVPTTVGFYMFIDHRVLANHRGLRSHFGVGYEEENDLVMRAGKTGMRAIMVNRAFAFHAGSASFSLTDIDLDAHRQANHLKMVADHPEFLPLVRRYEASAHYRAERLMAGLLPDAKRRLRVCFDLTSLGQHHNGTNEHTTSVLRSLVARWSDRIAFTGIGSERSFCFHGLDRLDDFARAEPGAAGVHGVAIRMSQPFDLHHLNVLDSLAPINIYAMLDTIAEDSGPLAQDGGFIELWDFVAEHANGFLYNSRFTAREFVLRHRAAAGRPNLAMLLSTRVEEYPAARGKTEAPGHILVLGNHFPHKASDEAGRRLAAAFPDLQVVALGANDEQSGNLQVIRPGTISAGRMRDLYSDASVVVLPSHLEGFGLGLMHALAAGKPVAVRNIPATREIPAIAGAVRKALAAERSHVDRSDGPGWNDWADGLGEMCLRLAKSDEVFGRLARRVYHGDLLRQARAYRESAEGTAQRVQPAPPAPPVSTEFSGQSTVERPKQRLETLLALDGRQFVQAAYGALLLREADQHGLDFYTTEVESGVGKLKVLEVLSQSAEGRAKGVVLEGLREAAAAEHVSRPLSLRRLLRRLGPR
jgi:GT2 family glycosyltransferase/glycosyltransferase involved in cell wall biosynthesis